MKVKPVLLLAFTIGISVPVISQNDVETPVIRNSIGASPNAAAMAKYTNGSESLATGALTVTIPVTTVNSRQLSLPIVLNYISNGIRVNEVESWSGLGWSLMAGGVITRTMEGLPDEHTGGFIDNAAEAEESNPNGEFSLATKMNLADGEIDMMPDVFSINSSFISGTFMFNNEGLPEPLPAGDIKIETFIEPSEDNSIHVTLASGVKLIFGGSGATEESQVYIAGPDPGAYTSAWYLKYAISPDKLDTITFNYSSHTFHYPIIQNSTLFVFTTGGIGSDYLSHEYRDISESSIDIDINNAKVLDEILYAGGKVAFEHSSAGTGIYNRKLDGIKLYVHEAASDTYTFKDSYLFTYQVSSGGRLFLTNFRRQNYPDYEFSYVDKTLPDFGAFSQDHWGYSNGAINNSTLLPKMYFGLGYPNQGGDREAHINYTDAGILKSVKSPQGAVTTYHMQQNTVESGGEEFAFGGLRLEKVEILDPISGIHSFTNYDYTDPATGLSSGQALQGFGYRSEHAVQDGIVETTWPNDYHCTMVMALQPTVGSNPGSPVMYERVTRYEGNDQSFRGKTAYEFLVNADGSGGSWPYVKATDNSWKRGFLLEQITYKYESGNFYKVSKVENTYSTSLTDNDPIQGLKGHFTKIIRPSYVTATAADISINKYFAFIGFPYLSNSKTYTYDPDDENTYMLTEVDYEYGSAHHYFLTKTISTDSKQREVISEIKYPEDFGSAGIYGQLQTNHILSVPLESKTYITNTNNLIAHSKTDFTDFGSGRLYPHRIYSRNFSEPTQEPSTWNDADFIEFEYNSYGIVESSSSSNQEESCSLYAGNGNYLIASVRNASTAEVAFTGFEFTEDPGWNVTGSSQTTKAKTGTHSYTLTAGAISKTGLGEGRYILSFWKNGAAVNVSGISASAATGESIQLGANTWQYVYYIFEVPASTTVNLTITGSAYIDELRLHPLSAAMSTMSYDDLGRIIDSTGPDQNTIYREYNNRHQISVLRDRYKNKLQETTIEYAEN